MTTSTRAFDPYRGQRLATRTLVPAIFAFVLASSLVGFAYLFEDALAGPFSLAGTLLIIVATCLGLALAANASHQLPRRARARRTLRAGIGLSLVAAILEFARWSIL